MNDKAIEKANGEKGPEPEDGAARGLEGRVSRILAWQEVQRLIGGLSQSQVYSLMRQGLFPVSIQLGPRARGWYEHEIHDWLRTRPRAELGEGRRFGRKGG